MTRRETDTPELVALRDRWNSASIEATKLCVRYDRARERSRNVLLSTQKRYRWAMVMKNLEEKLSEADKVQAEAWKAYSAMLREMGLLPSISDLLGMTNELTS
jgi:hypothetical protein